MPSNRTEPFKECPAWAWCLGLALGLSLMLMPGLSAAQAEGQEMSLEELLQLGLGQSPRNVEVSTASRFAQSASQTPSVTHVVTAQDIKTFGLRNMADILRSLPGLYVSSDGAFSYIGARGLSPPSDYNTRLLFLVNGVRLNENVYDAVLPGNEFPIDVALIERVEFAPGPGSALYGNNAFFGVINIITKRVDKLQGLELQVRGDSGHRRQVRASVGRRLEDGAEVLASLTHYRAKPMDISLLGFENVPAKFVDPLGESNSNEGSKLLTHYISGGLQLRLGAHVDTRRYPVPVGDIDNTVIEAMVDRNRASFVSAHYERALNADWDLALSLASHRASYQSTRPLFQPSGEINWVRVAADGEWWNGDLRFSNLSWPSHHLVFGLDYQYDQRQELSVRDIEATEPFSRDTGRSRRLGLYLQDNYQLNTDTRLLLGLRRDHSGNDSTVNPRLGMVWSGVPEASLKLLYGSAFRAANLFESGANMSVNVPPPAPERVRTFELAWDQSLSSGLRYQVSAYHSRIHGLISLYFDGDAGIGYFKNRSGVSTKGLELSVEQRWASGLQASATASLQHSRDDNGLLLANSPRTLLKWKVSAPLWNEDWRLGWQFNGMSSRLGGPDLKFPAHGLHHLNLLWRANAETELSLNLLNVGNRRYRDPPNGGTPPRLQEGRVLTATLTWRLPR